MTIEPQIVSVGLAAIIGLQAWIVRQLFKLEKKMALLIQHCQFCRGEGEDESDTDRIIKLKG